MPLHRALLLPLLAAAPLLPQGAPVQTRAPDVAAELSRFAPGPPSWSAGIVNAFSALSLSGARERRNGWLSQPEHWLLGDAVDRAGNLISHDWLARRELRADVYGANE